MYSKYIRFIIGVSGLFPVLLIFWLENTLAQLKQLSVYIDYHFFGSFVQQNYLLLLFVVLLIISKLLLNYAKTHLTPWAINIKSIKPADPNFVSMLLSYLLPWFKIFITSGQDYIYVTGYILIAIIYGIVNASSYHYNISFRIFFCYRHYEVQTTGEVTYLLLSNHKLVNKNQVKSVVKLTDFYLIDLKT